ncbi:MAG: hypothetical protein ACREM9_06380 [Gemmatimonadales bacterium]
MKVLVAGLALTLSACSHGTGDVEPDNRRVTVEVRNQHALPMEVYALGAGSFHRLGVVHPGMDGTFYIPRNLVGSGSVQLEARPSGNGAQPFRSGDLLLNPGSVLDFIIAPQLFSSTVTQRP